MSRTTSAIEQEGAGCRRNRPGCRAILLAAAISMAACGGGSGSSTDGNADRSGGQTENVREVAYDETGLPTSPGITVEGADVPTSRTDASRLLQQASFGPTPASIDAVATRGTVIYLRQQFVAPVSRYSYTLAENRYRSDVHGDARRNFCAERGEADGDDCWRDWFSSVPAEWDFFRHAVHGPDQLRQRIAFTLGQIFVASAKELAGTYAFAEYHQMLRDNAFGNFRTLLEKVTLSPFMGTYLNMVNNDGAAPNENYARELLQLFSLGTCLLSPTGENAGGKCVPTYDNATVRHYAYALSGWTYPPGGRNPWCDGCDGWQNPPFMRGEMVPVDSHHDTEPRQLLSGIVASGGRSAREGLQAVLDSIMAHPNVGPFISRQFIQFLVTSNPSSGYVARVAQAFDTGRHGDFGTGVKGDMQAMLVAILLDGEARDAGAAQGTDFGKLREPVLFATGAIRALDGHTDGVPLSSYQWGRLLGQPVFNAPSVFNFYPPDYPLPGSALVAPQFGIENTNTTLARLNFANALVYWWYNGNAGLAADDDVPSATGTGLRYERFEALIDDPAQGSGKAVRALNELLLDGRMNATEETIITRAMDTWGPRDTWLTSPSSNSTWQRERVKTAAYLILASPHYQIQR